MVGEGWSQTQVIPACLLPGHQCGRECSGPMDITLLNMLLPTDFPLTPHPRTDIFAVCHQMPERGDECENACPVRELDHSKSGQQGYEIGEPDQVCTDMGFRIPWGFTERVWLRY